MNKQSTDRREQLAETQSQYHHAADINAANAIPVANRDQEAMVKDRIRTAIEMAIALKKVGGTGADERTLLSGIDGIVNGVTVEIIYLLGLKPEFTNLRDPFRQVRIGPSPFPSPPAASMSKSSLQATQ